MRRFLLAFLFAPVAFGAIAAHPRLFMTPTILTNVETRLTNSISAGAVTDSDWLNSIHFCDAQYTSLVNSQNGLGTKQVSGGGAPNCAMAYQVLKDVKCSGNVSCPDSVQNGSSGPCHTNPITGGAGVCGTTTVNYGGTHSAHEYAWAAMQAVLGTLQAERFGGGSQLGKFTLTGAAGHKILSQLTTDASGNVTVSIDNSKAEIQPLATYAFTSIAISNSNIGLQSSDYYITSISGSTGTDTLVLAPAWNTTPCINCTETNALVTLNEYSDNNHLFPGNDANNCNELLAIAYDWTYFDVDGTTKLYNANQIKRYVWSGIADTDYFTIGPFKFNSGWPGANPNIFYGFGSVGLFMSLNSFGDSPTDSGGTNPQITAIRNTFFGSSANLVGFPYWAVGGLAHGGQSPEGSDYQYLSYHEWFNMIFANLTADGTDWLTGDVTQMIINMAQSIIYLTCPATQNFEDGTQRYAPCGIYNDLGGAAGMAVTRPSDIYYFHPDVRADMMIGSFLLRTYESGVTNVSTITQYIKYWDTNVLGGTWNNGSGTANFQGEYWVSAWFVDSTTVAASYTSSPKVFWSCNSGPGFFNSTCPQGDTGQANLGATNLVISRASWFPVTLDGSSFLDFTQSRSNFSHSHAMDGAFAWNRGGAWLTMYSWNRDAEGAQSSTLHPTMEWRTATDIIWKGDLSGNLITTTNQGFVPSPGGFEAATGGQYVFLKYDNSNSYHSTSAPSVLGPWTNPQKVFRSFIHFPGSDVLLVQDLATFTNPTWLRWQHFVPSNSTTPVWNGTYLKHSNTGGLGTSNLFVTPLKPGSLIETTQFLCSDSAASFTAGNCGQTAFHPQASFTNSTTPATAPNGYYSLVLSPTDGFTGSGQGASCNNVGSTAGTLACIATDGTGTVATVWTNSNNQMAAYLARGAGIGGANSVRVCIQGASDAALNVCWAVPTTVSANAFTYPVSGATANAFHTESTITVTYESYETYHGVFYNFESPFASGHSGAMAGWKITWDQAPAAAATLQDSVYAYQATDSTQATPTATNLISSTSNLDVAQVAFTSGDIVGGFVNTISTATVTTPVSFSITGAGSSGTYVLTGFAPNTTFKVTGSGNESITIDTVGGGTSVPSSSNGVLAFNAAGASITALSTGPTCVITNLTLPTGSVGVPYSATITTNGCTSPSFALSGAPGTLSINASSGVISGTPVATFSGTVTVNVTDASGNPSQNFGLTIISLTSHQQNSIIGGTLVEH